MASLNAINNIPGTADLVAAGWQGFPQDTLIARFAQGFPDSVAVGADSFNVTRGQVISGTIADLAESDDADLSSDEQRQTSSRGPNSRSRQSARWQILLRWKSPWKDRCLHVRK